VNGHAECVREVYEGIGSTGDLEYAFRECFRNEGDVCKHLSGLREEPEEGAVLVSLGEVVLALQNGLHLLKLLEARSE